MRVKAEDTHDQDGRMNQVWIVVLVVAALYFLSRLRRRQKHAGQKREPQPPRIFGYQVNAYLHPRMGQGCLFDNGVQYGKGFRRKEGPQLPHDAYCQCEAVPFNFTSSEVFNGALRGVANIRSTLPDFPLPSARLLIEKLKRVDGQPLPENPETYLATVGLEGFSEARQSDVRAFLLERYQFLKAGREAGESAAVDNDTATDEAGTPDDADPTETVGQP